MLTAPFVIYCDMEMFIQEEEVVKRGKIVSHWHHISISVAALTVCQDCPELGLDPFLYTGIDCVDVLMDYLDHEVVHLNSVYDNFNVPCYWTESERINFDAEENCVMCNRAFSPHQIKAQDQCHISGQYWFALCSECNLTWAKRPFEVVVLFHGLSNYDSHSVVCKLAVMQHQRHSEEQQKVFDFQLLLFAF